jgi:outer membrane protein assembly factor BamB
MKKSSYSGKLLVTCLLFITVFTGCKKEKKQKHGLKENNLPVKKIVKKEKKLKATLMWEKSFNSFVKIADVDETFVYGLGFKKHGKKLIPKTQIALDPLTGTIKWIRKRSFRLFKRKTLESIRFSLKKDQVFYVSKFGSIYPLSKSDGSPGKKLNSIAGFIDLGSRLFIADKHPFFYNISNGKTEYIPGLKPISKSIPVKISKRFPVTRLGNTIAFRTQDGILRGVDQNSGKELWNFKDKFDRRMWSSDLPYSNGIVLIPTLYPKSLPRTILKWKNEDKILETTLPGKIKDLNPHTFGSLTTIFLSSGQSSTLFSTINNSTGKLLYTKEIPKPKCSFSSGFIVCRKNKTITTYEQKTGNIAYKKVLSRKIRFVSSSMELFATQMSDGEIQIFKLNDGKLLWKKKIKIKNANTKLLSLVYGIGDRVALALKTSHEFNAIRNRIYIDLFSLVMPDFRKIIQIGKPYTKHREPRYYTDYSRDIPINMPVWVKNNKIYTAIKGNFTVINVDKGRHNVKFTLPGLKRRKVSLVSVKKHITLLERGNLLIAIGKKDQIKWKTGIRNFEISLITNDKIFLNGETNFKVINLEDGKIVNHPFEKDKAGKFKGIIENKWFVNSSRKNLVYLNETVSKSEKNPNYSIFNKNISFSVYKTKEITPGKGSWTAINVKTGQNLWSYIFKKNASEIGASKSISTLQPRDSTFFPHYWIKGISNGFLVPGPTHKCIYLINPENGAVRWVRCFHRLGGKPVFDRKNKTIYLSAVPPYGEPGKPLKGEISSGEGNLQLFGIKSLTGKTISLYKAPSPYSIELPFKFPLTNHLIITLYKEKDRKYKSILHALSLSIK